MNDYKRLGFLDGFALDPSWIVIRPLSLYPLRAGQAILVIEIRPPGHPTKFGQIFREDIDSRKGDQYEYEVQKGIRMLQSKITAHAEANKWPRQEPSMTTFVAQLESLYEHGASPDRVYMSLESAHERGLISCWEFLWRRVLRLYRTGIWKPNARSGVRSVLRTRGTGKTE